MHSVSSGAAIAGAVTMLRLARLSFVSGAAVLAVASAVAQAPQIEPDSALCPRDALTVYYARGEAAPTDQARIILSRIGDDAKRCRPDAIDLVAGVNAEGEGAVALSLALARLNGVADALVKAGFPMERIRIAAQRQAGFRSSPMGEITVLFRHSAGADDAAAPAKESGRPASRDAI